MVYLGYMIPVTEKIHEELIYLANLNCVSPETFMTMLIEAHIKEQTGVK